MPAEHDPTTWVEVDTAALEANLHALSKHVGVPVCAVVKANAYGHGLVGAATTLAAAGAAMLGVTRIEEARALRAAGVSAPILILTPVIDPREAVSLDCDITVSSSDGVDHLPSEARVHLKVDTGMGRLGVRPEDAFHTADLIKRRCSLEAVWTHLADAAGTSGAKQLAMFETVVRAVREGGIHVSAHAANSAGAIALPGARFDMVRTGTVLYGQHPAGVQAPWPLAETFRWFARVVAVGTVPAGATVGYASEWRARAPTRLATIPVGYTDGFTLEPVARTPNAREVARRMKNAVVGADRVVYFDDVAAPVVGRVAMQSITVDVTDIPGIEVGRVARIPARRLLVGPLIEREYV